MDIQTEQNTEDTKAGLLERALERPVRLGDKILLGIFIVLFLYVFYISLDANKYRALVRVVDGKGVVGVNPTDQALDFGDLSRGTSAVRRVEIVNKTFLPMYIVAIRSGSIVSLIDIDRNFFRLNPRETVKIEYSVYMPASAEIDKIYNGRVYLLKIPII
jgi:hypothetical protein